MVDTGVKSERIAVIGAGSSGLSSTKALLERGFAVDCFEREDEVGGNWNIHARNARVYPSTHLISSKPFTAYPDFPMPDRFPDYPHHSEVLEYFQRYADHFDLRPQIKFATDVMDVSRLSDGWAVAVRDRDGGLRTETYAAVVVANGHNWNPKKPSYVGLDSFPGEVLHSADYTGPDVLRDKRVLVVGAGNTGCDLAVESAQTGATVTYHSTRRGYYYNPKYAMGRPSDQVADSLLAMKVPLGVRRLLYKATLRMTVGDLTRFGLAKPDHKFYETHPIVNQLLPYYVGQGDIRPKPDIATIDGRTIHFSDGSSADVDLILFCTGYLVRFDFLSDVAHLNWRDTHPELYLHVFTPQHDDLFVAGLIQPDSGQFCLAHWQGQAIAAYLDARRSRPDSAARFRAAVAAHADARFTGGTHYAESTRHYFEVAHHEYLSSLETAINQLDGVA